MLTLRKLFQTIVTYCLRFFSTISEMQRQMQVQGGIGAVQVGVEGYRGRDVGDVTWRW